MTSSTWRWSVPVALTAAVAAAVGLSTVSAGATPQLPARSAAQILARAATAKVAGVSGDVQIVANLGLPQLPSGDAGGGAGLSGWSTLVAGTNTLRVWASRTGGLRVALPSQLAESDLVVGGTGAWFYDSQSNTATHVVVPKGTSASAGRADMTRQLPPLTPQQAAGRVLAAIGRSASVVVQRDAEVAGRSAYQIGVRPDNNASLIGRITLSVDARTGLPLRVQVFARGARTPALEIGYTHLHIGAVPAARFRFTPPPGATVKTMRLPRMTDRAAHTVSRADRPRVLGKGWTAVLLIPNVHLRGSLAAEFGQLGRPVSGRFGSGELVRTALVDALLTSDGRLLVGAVTPATLEAAAASGR